MNISKETLPAGPYRKYMKRTPTPAMLVNLPGWHTVHTLDGPVVVRTPFWLAIDDFGYPYPINAQVFAKSYMPMLPA